MIDNSFSTPRIGVAVFIFHEGKILMGKRLSPHGKGFWALPGGHLEPGETIEQCAKREALEEVNLTISNVKSGPCTNDFFHDSKKHYITHFMMSDTFEGELKTMEPEKCEKWQWFDIDDLPTPKFLPMDELFQKTTLRGLYSQFYKSHKIAYLACPFAHQDQNVMNFRKEIVTRVAAELHNKEMFVFSPLTHNFPLIELGVTQNWETWSKFDLSMLLKCDALYVLKLDGWELSRGVQAEIAFAKTYDLPIIELEYDIDNHTLVIPKEKTLTTV